MMQSLNNLIKVAQGWSWDVYPRACTLPNVYCHQTNNTEHKSC